MDSDIGKIQKLISLYETFLKQDYLIITHQTPIESLNEDKAENDNLALTINAEIKKIEKKFGYCPLPLITDKLLGKKRVLKGESKAKVKHLVPIKSVDNMELEDKLSNYFNDITDLYFMPKFDGVSCVCWYENGELIYATKSNDKQGENISHILNFIIPSNVIKEFFTNNPEIIGIRGELILDRNYSPNTTRLADLNGFLLSKHPDLDMFKYLHWVIYFVYKNPELEITKNLFWYLNELKNSKLETTLYSIIPKNVDKVDANDLKTLSETLKVNFDCDGIIFRKDNLDFDQSIKVKFAYYFEAKVTAIDFQLGEKSGVYVPRIYIQYHDESIAKSLVRINGYNLSYMYLNRVQIGSTISVKFTGDSIAVFNSVLSKPFPQGTIDKYIHYLKSNCKGLDKAIIFENEFIGKIDILYNFLKEQKIPNAADQKLKLYLTAIYPYRLEEEDKYKLFKNYLHILREENYNAVKGMPIETIKSYSSHVIKLINNKDNILQLAINAISVQSLTYFTFNKYAHKFNIDIDSKTNHIIDISIKPKIDINITIQLILNNRKDLIKLYNLMYDY